MYEEFYGLSDKPFHLSPDPSFFFESQGHTRALAYLHYGVEQGEGFVVVTGDIGTGKTMLARMLFEELERSNDVIVADLSLQQVSATDLMHMIADSFGATYENGSKASVLKGLFTFLEKRYSEGKRAVLLIDEVQNLPPPALEALRTLSNLQVGGQPLLQSILLGQAEFRRLLSAPILTQLRQRVIASTHLSPFERVEETRAYIEHRMRHVDWNSDPSISDEAFEAIHTVTEGVPRRINTFCDRLLLFAYLEELNRISSDTVSAVADEISDDLTVVPPTAGDPVPEQADIGASEPHRLAALEQRVRRLEAMLEGVRQGIESGKRHSAARINASTPARGPGHSPDQPLSEPEPRERRAVGGANEPEAPPGSGHRTG